MVLEVPRVNLMPFITAQLVVAAIFFFSTPASADAPVVERPHDVVVVSSTTLTVEGSEGFTMTATNIGDEAQSFTLLAPAEADLTTVDTGSWDGAWWQASLPSGATATMTGHGSQL